MTQQGNRHEAFRQMAGGLTSGDYNSNLIAASEFVTGLTGLTVNGAEIELLRTLAGSTDYNLEDLRARMATQLGASDWSSLGDLPYFALGFDTGRTTLPSSVTFTRASTSYDVGDSGGTLTSYSSGTPKLNDRGLLVEGAATNLGTYSQDLTTGWTTNNSSVSSNATTAPDGTTTADAVIEDGTAADVHRIQTPSFTVASGTTYTVSIFAKLKDAGRPIAVIQTTGNLTAGVSYFDVSTGTVGTQAAAHTNGAMEALANGWYRITFNVDGAASGATLLLLYGAPTEAVTWNGDTTSGIYWWQYDVVAADFATSPILTTSATATRAADVLTMAFTDSATGTIMVEDDPLDVTNHNGYAFQIDDGTNNNRHAAFIDSGSIRTLTIVGGVAQASITGAVSVGSTNKRAYAWAANDVARATAGSIDGTDTSATMPSGLDTLRIGSGLGGGNVFNGHISRLIYWPSRLANAQLQAITA